IVSNLIVLYLAQCLTYRKSLTNTIIITIIHTVTIACERCFVSPTEDRAAQSLLNKLIHSNLVDSAIQVDILQRDPKSPLYSVKSFEELKLKPQLLQGVYAMGFNRPSKIQENALPMMLSEPYVCRCGVWPGSSRLLPGNLVALERRKLS
uniref:RNA helicase n=1 Tax=Ornithorhynchus anatinus TaxID=9258 RepID=A0A6I8PKZ9_ORNAN